MNARSASITGLILIAAIALWAGAAQAEPVPVSPSGTTSVPAIEVPSSALMSSEGNASRVEHILTERSLKGRSVDQINAALFGPRLQRTRVAYPVTERDETIGGVHVRIYEPRAGIAPTMRGRVLLHVHGGGFVGCFTECGGLEAIPVAAEARVRVISIDYRLAPAAKFPEASEDVAAVYRAVLRTTPANHVGLYGCSAGGLLTAQSLAWFQHQGLPRPAAAWVFCAGGDPGMGGDSRYTGMLLGDGELPAVGRAGAPQTGYMRGASPADPTAYPARDAATLAKFPPTLVVVGTRDFALSSAVNLHSKLIASGVDARLHVWEGGRHAFFYDARVPEAQEAYRVMAKFFTERLR
jgi:acetyl esterase/lipase